MKWSKQTYEKIGDFFQKKYNEFFFESPSDHKYKEFLKENNVQEFNIKDLYLCINEKTEDNIIVYRKTSVSKTIAKSNSNDWEITSATYSTSSLDFSKSIEEARIYILVPKDFAEKIFILEKLKES